MTIREKTIEAMARAIARVQFAQSGQFGRKGITQQTEKYWTEWIPEAHLAFDAAIQVLMEPDVDVVDASVWDHQKADISLARGTAFAIWTDMLKAASQ